MCSARFAADPQSGLTVVLATHNMEIAARMDRRVTIRDRQIVELDVRPFRRNPRCRLRGNRPAISKYA